MSSFGVRTTLVNPAGQHDPPLLGQKEAITQVDGVPVHVPDWQLWDKEHTLPTLHGVPSALTGLEHTPVDVLHVPAV